MEAGEAAVRQIRKLVGATVSSQIVLHPVFIDCKALAIETFGNPQNRAMFIANCRDVHEHRHGVPLPMPQPDADLARFPILHGAVERAGSTALRASLMIAMHQNAVSR